VISSGGSVIGNGAGWTNIPYSNITGGPINNLSAGMSNYVTSIGTVVYTNLGTGMSETMTTNMLNTTASNTVSTSYNAVIGLATFPSSLTSFATNNGTSYAPTNTAPWTKVYYPMTLGSSYTTPPQRGYVYASVMCTNTSVTCLSNMTSHDVDMVQTEASRVGTNQFKLQLYTQAGDIVSVTNLQVSGVTLLTNYWIGF
jgi:hypothetical protein